LGGKYRVLSPKDVERIHNASLQTFIGGETMKFIVVLDPAGEGGFDVSVPAVDRTFLGREMF